MQPNFLAGLHKPAPRVTIFWKHLCDTLIHRCGFLRFLDLSIQ